MVESVDMRARQASTPPDADGRADAEWSTKEQLMRAAYRVITRRGASRLSVRDIAAEAQLSRGLVHYHFRDKEDLVSQTLMWAVRETVRRVRAALRQPAYTTDPLSVLIDAIWADARANHGFYLAYVGMIERIGRGETYSDEFGDVARDVFEGLLIDTISYAAGAGLIGRDDIADAARDGRSIIDGVFTQWLQEGDWEATHAAYRAQARRLLGMVLLEQASRAHADASVASADADHAT